MSLTPADLSSYVAGYNERLAAQKARDKIRCTELENKLSDVVNVLVRDFGVTQVVLFGSLARQEAGMESDVDLLVYGLPLQKLMEATVAAERIIKITHVDLVPYEIARKDILQRALAEGKVLYG
jgi:predicted nucleotidyltransferase